jgi:Disulphide bond corrector protein DsbC
MRLVFAVALLALMSTIPVGAEEDPSRAIQWSWTLQPADARPGSEAELVLVAVLAPHWVVYSSDFKADFGPLPVRLRKKPQSGVELVEGLRSISASRKRDESLDIEYGYFAGRAELRQRLKLPADGSPAELTLNGQACNETDGTCHLIRQDIRVAAQVASAARQ